MLLRELCVQNKIGSDRLRVMNKEAMAVLIQLEKSGNTSGHKMCASC